jgi:hypothetical protein
MQMSKDIGSFTFSILLKQQQKRLDAQSNQGRIATIGRDVATS